MRSVGIKLLKNKLSEYIRLAAGGEAAVVLAAAEPIGPRSWQRPRWYISSSASF